MERDNDAVAMAMLAMAETFRTVTPSPKIKVAIKCARGAQKLPNLSAHVSAHVNLQLGKILISYTEDYELARESLELAYDKLQAFGDYMEGFRLEAVQLLCEVYVHGVPTQANSIRVCNLIRAELPFVKHNPTMFSKFLFYFIEASCNTGSIGQAVECCDLGMNTFRGKDLPLELYFRITKALVIMRHKEDFVDEDEHEMITKMISALEPKSYHALNLQLFYDSIQVVTLLHEGKTRSVRMLLRSIQLECTDLVKYGNTVPGIRWIDPTALTAFTCCLTMASSSYQTSLERCNKYFGLVVRHVNDYLTRAAKVPTEYGGLRSVQRTRMIANEFGAQNQILACKPADALNNMKDMMLFLSKLGNNCVLLSEFNPICQNLLGLHCIYLRDYEKAERHFRAALDILGPTNKNAYCLVNTNLSLLYLQQCKHAEYYSVAELLTPNRVDRCTMIVKANVKFTQAFHAFLLKRTEEFRQTSEDALNIAKSEDIFRLHNLIIILCSQFFAVSEDALITCINWGQKGFDHMMLCWAHDCLARLKRSKGEDASESEFLANEARKLISVDYIKKIHEENPAHGLVGWFEGDPLDHC